MKDSQSKSGRMPLCGSDSFKRCDTSLATFFSFETDASPVVEIFNISENVWLYGGKWRIHRAKVEECPCVEAIVLNVVKQLWQLKWLLKSICSL